MQRQLLLLAILVGCGNVQGSAPVDGASPSPGSDSGAESDPTDVLRGTLRNGCVLALHMDEAAWSGAAGEVADDCGGDNPGSVSGLGTSTVDSGVHGRAGRFTGDGCIDIANASALHGTTGLTLSAWILPTVLDGGVNNANGVISKRTDSKVDSEYNLSVWLQDQVYVDLDGDNDRFNSSATIRTNAWTQLTLAYDGTLAVAQRARLYVNGSLDTAKQETSASLTPFTSTLHVGCMPAPAAGTQQNFVGKLDEVVIWNRALSDAEVQQWYANTKP